MFPECDVNNDDCWLNRWYDGVIRYGNGVNGWRRVNICLSEGPAYLYIRGVISSADARAWATSGRNLATACGVTVSFMNGLPY